LLEIPGAKEIGVEFHTLSKTYNMAGWRVGFVVGNRHIIQGLADIKNESGLWHLCRLANSC
jgi:LL-diaminopimelate aminotransferase